MQTRTATLVWLILSQALYILSLLPWLVAAGLAVMAFDAPESTRMWQPWLFVGVVWSYPLWLLACGAAAWVLYARGRHRVAIVATSVPLLAALVLALLVFAGG
ncbi:MAG: hypothetical protein AB1806_15725 [Acidobacteriota bacterium]